ncbi:MAG: hypothetical protein K0U98_25460 [Deltaproteobacteria bacterium]|nr:hypothetical protein [Deltaproteobacteria bacterium]
MRELTRSMMRISLAMPLLGMNQMANLVSSGGRPPLEPIAETFDALSEVAQNQMTPRLRDLYDQGDRLQRQVLDRVFGLLKESGDQRRDSISDF